VTRLSHARRRGADSDRHGRGRAGPPGAGCRPPPPNLKADSDQRPRRDDSDDPADPAVPTRTQDLTPAVGRRISMMTRIDSDTSNPALFARPAGRGRHRHAASVRVTGEAQLGRHDGPWRRSGPDAPTGGRSREIRSHAQLYTSFTQALHELYTSFTRALHHTSCVSRARIAGGSFRPPTHALPQPPAKCDSVRRCEQSIGAEDRFESQCVEVESTVRQHNGVSAPRRCAGFILDLQEKWEGAAQVIVHVQSEAWTRCACCDITCPIAFVLLHRAL
jgi:hypothetical protein